MARKMSREKLIFARSGGVQLSRHIPPEEEEEEEEAHFTFSPRRKTPAEKRATFTLREQNQSGAPPLCLSSTAARYSAALLFMQINLARDANLGGGDGFDPPIIPGNLYYCLLEHLSSLYDSWSVAYLRIGHADLCLFWFHVFRACAKSRNSRDRWISGRVICAL